MKCRNCGSENPEGARFCYHCGAMLDESPVNPDYQPAALREPGKGMKFLLASAHALVYLALYFAVQIFVMMIASFMIMTGAMLSGSVAIPGSEPDFDAWVEDYVTDMMMPVFENVHTILIMSAAATILILAISFAVRKKSFGTEICLAPLKLRRILLIGVGAVAMQLFVAMTISILPIPESVLEQFTETNSVLLGGSLWLQILNVAVFTPILEEIIFRGLVFTRLRRGMSTALAVILSALIFGIAHGTWIAFVYASVLGVLMALLMLKYRTLAASIAFHMVFNAASYLALPAEMPDAVFYILYAVSALICAGVAVLIVIDKDKEIKNETL